MDGHDTEALRQALSPRDAAGAPLVVLARTVFGKGVSFMEGQLRWHYWPLSDEEFQAAAREVETGR